MPFMTPEQIAEERRQIALLEEANARAEAAVTEIVLQARDKLLEMRALADALPARLAQTLP